MKWMGGWSWEDYNECPLDIKLEIVKMINEEIEARENV